MLLSHAVPDEALGSCFDLPRDNPTSIYDVLLVDGFGQLCPFLLAALSEPGARKPKVQQVCTPFLAEKVFEQLSAILVIQ